MENYARLKDYIIKDLTKAHQEVVEGLAVRGCVDYAAYMDLFGQSKAYLNAIDLIEKASNDLLYGTNKADPDG